mmetsp:Transcript_6230/g.17744  ORF Transcript_6230/g.17744 Transcript_6230/m.17744 type:complete len:471 (-) Transcript_6230:225-1637(-)
MTPRILPMSLVGALSLLQSEALWQIQNSSQCDPFGVELCMNKKRKCYLYEDGRQTCGPCELGYIEIAGGGAGAGAGGGGQEQSVDVNVSSSCVQVADIVWSRFTDAHNPLYVTPEDDALRLALVTKSAKMISDHNALDFDSTYTLGLTPYSADTETEYLQRSGYFYADFNGTDYALPFFDPMTWANADIPNNVDWVAAGAVTPVKDQGRCASSWAIGICGAVEGAAFLNDGYKKSLGFQQLISCNKRNLGCEGGSMDIAASYISSNWFGGVAALEEYPYSDADGVTTEDCQLTRESPALAVEVTDIIRVAGLDELMTFEERLGMFKLALLERPIAVIMKSSCVLFSNYLSGILTDDGDCACSDSSCYDHVVLMVGYNDTGDTPYFTLKNSWGTKWGEEGYFRVAQIEKGEHGLFGIFAEGVMVGAEESQEAEINDRSNSERLPKWAIVLIVLSPLLLLCCLCKKKPVNIF